MKQILFIGIMIFLSIGCKKDKIQNHNWVAKGFLNGEVWESSIAGVFDLNDSSFTLNINVFNEHDELRESLKLFNIPYTESLNQILKSTPSTITTILGGGYTTFDSDGDVIVDNYYSITHEQSYIEILSINEEEVSGIMGMYVVNLDNDQDTLKFEDISFLAKVNN
ncbi:MAG: hypothetical protein AB8H03_03660 [Saprospiraceae bacterium]